MLEEEYLEKRKDDTFDINNEFVERQLKLSLEAIKDLNPSIIVVNNALASELICEKFGEEKIPFNEEEGFHTLLLNNGNKIPIFFSSMLSGQRALDKHTYKRLIWHIKKAKSWQEKNETKEKNP